MLYFRNDFLKKKKMGCLTSHWRKYLSGFSYQIVSQAETIQWKKKSLFQ